MLQDEQNHLILYLNTTNTSKMRPQYIIICIIFAAIITCCTSSIEQTKPARIKRLDLAIEQYSHASPSERVATIDSFNHAIETLRIIYPEIKSNDSLLQMLSESQGVKIFTPDIRQRLLSLDSIEIVLGQSRDNIKVSLPVVRFPSLVAIVSTFNQSIIYTDSIMLIGLNHYLGNDYPGYVYFESYQRYTKTPQHLPYDIIESIILNKYPYRPNNNATTLNRILYEGAIIATLIHLIPNASLSEALGCTPTQLQWLFNNERQAWQALITRQYLYSTDPMIAERLANPAPATTILHPEAPGRAGRFIGVRIVEAYLKTHPNTTFDYLLSPSFYNSPTSLIEASYAP